MDGITELFELSKRLDELIKKCAKASVEFATAEREYKIALSQATLKLRSQEYPVTIIPYVVKGIGDVADKRFKRDVAEANYWTANKEYDSLKLQITLLDRQVSREWNNER